MKLIRLEGADDALFEIPPEAFSDPVTVQGACRRSYRNALLIESGRRYKLFTEGRDTIRIVRGEGHFKWARGETPFRAGETFLAEGLGEYEINGAGVFLVIRS